MSHVRSGTGALRGREESVRVWSPCIKGGRLDCLRKGELGDEERKRIVARVRQYPQGLIRSSIAIPRHARNTGGDADKGNTRTYNNICLMHIILGNLLRRGQVILPNYMVADGQTREDAELLVMFQQTTAVTAFSPNTVRTVRRCRQPMTKLGYTG